MLREDHKFCLTKTGAVMILEKLRPGAKLGLGDEAGGAPAPGGNINILNGKLYFMLSTNFKLLSQLQGNSTNNFRYERPL
jgi:hypothetical protein